jgi:hypothetical protein
MSVAEFGVGDTSVICSGVPTSWLGCLSGLFFFDVRVRFTLVFFALALFTLVFFAVNFFVFRFLTMRLPLHFFEPLSDYTIRRLFRDHANAWPLSESDSDQPLQGHAGAYKGYRSAAQRSWRCVRNLRQFSP